MTWPAFAPGSIWNTPIPAGVPASPRSVLQVAHLLSKMPPNKDELGREFPHPTINYWQYTMPLYRASYNTRLIPVKLTKDDYGAWNDVEALREVLAQGVPIPAGMVGAEGSDRSCALYCEDTDRLWELWLFNGVQRVTSTVPGVGPTAHWGGFIPSVSESLGYYHRPFPGWGVSAGSLVNLGGRITFQDGEQVLAGGHIEHALVIGLPTVDNTEFSYPAQRAEGSMGTSHADALPLGSRLQLNLAYDTAQLPNPFARAIARCLQTHGAWVGDYASAPAFLAEDSSKGVGAEWGWERSWRLTYWDSEYPDASSGQPGFLHPARFPWAELRVLDAPLRTRPYGP